MKEFADVVRHIKIFIGQETEGDPDCVHIYRDRQASRIDCSRAVTDGEYYFIRNFIELFFNKFNVCK